jgi:hypothetical protein
MTRAAPAAERRPFEPEALPAHAADEHTVTPGGRRKAYRPRPADDRHAALIAAVAAWRRRDWFEAHELLEPAWMGTREPLERDLYQGLIKLAAAYVHRARGNALGLAANLAGADSALRRVAESASVSQGVDVGRLLAEVGRRRPEAGGAADLDAEPPVLMLAEGA